MIDQWRWKVFSGEITPDEYNKAWWELRLKYQGIAPPGRAQRSRFRSRREVSTSPANVPYTRYFLADILQFQFHRALCRRRPAAPGPAAPLLDLRQQGGRREAEHDAGDGLSKPWPDALEAFTGKREMDATAILDYFAPLKEWLDEQNKGMKQGW